ncbi:MAG: ABC transporter substrate-binding protein [Clostridium sp.]|nr:ABC transporter substrate-binding protein [Clostridium sp.]
MKKLLTLLTVAVFTFTALTGCGGADPSAESDVADDDTIVIRSCFATGMTGAVNNFAIEKGLYQELGIEFDNVEWSSNDEVLSLMTRGEVDVADGDPSSFIPGIYNGVPAKLVGNMWRYSGCYWLVAGKDIESIEDLKGKTVGTATAAGGMRLSVLKMLEENGLKEDDVTLVANGVYQSAYATLTSGEVDATIIHNPYAALAEAEGTGHILGRAWDYIPDYYTGTIIASDRMIQDEPEKLQKFLTAYYKVHEEVKNEYFDEFVAWAAAQMNTSEDIMRQAIEAEKDVWFDYPVIPEDRIAKTVEYLKNYGWLDENVSADGTYTNEFAKKAAEELGLTDPEAN